MMKYGKEDTERKALDAMLSEESGETEMDEEKPKGDPVQMIAKIQSELDELMRQLG